LRRELKDTELEVAPLGHPGEAGTDAVLAGRFPEEVVPIAVELVESVGGEIVADVDERYTGPAQDQPRNSLN
jgi:hypothetical protein